MSRVNTRAEVWNSLIERERTGAFSGVLLKHAYNRCETATVSERSFIKRLLIGTIEQEQVLDGKIREVLKDPDTKIKGSIRCLLRMSAYQLLYMDSVPDYACVNEAVRLLKGKGLGSYTGFVNGVLHSMIRRRDKAAEETPARQGISTTLKPAQGRGGAGDVQVPEWISELFVRERGEEDAQALLSSLREIRPVTIRFMERLSEEEMEKYLSGMREQGVLVEPGNLLPRAYFLRKTGDIRKLPGFAEGAFAVQDESSQLTGRALSLQGNERVLDLCAAPGGKSMLAADILASKGDGSVVSCDVSGKKTELIRANAKRLKLANVEVLESDATVYRPEWEQAFDVVLADVPCSGLGVMGKKRDIAQNLDPKGLPGLTALQKRIVRNAVRYVKPGGTLLYSTCTIRKAENERMAAAIEKMPGMRASGLAEILPGVPGIEGNCLQLLPHVHGTDGFFMARFVREAETEQDGRVEYDGNQGL